MKLVVATYNIHGCVGLDWCADHGRIVRVLRGLEAEIIALQEVDNYHHEGTWRQHLAYFAEELRMEPIAGPTLTRRGLEYGNALLTRLPVLSMRRVEISVLGREPRGVVEADLSARGRVVRVIATHLGLDPKERKLQLETIRELVRDARAEVTIVLGDFNEWRLDGRRAFDEALGRTRAPRSFPAIFPVLALDRIWVLPHRHLRAIEAVARFGARYASDHLPVRALIEL